MIMGYQDSIFSCQNNRESGLYPSELYAQSRVTLFILIASTKLKAEGYVGSGTYQDIFGEKQAKVVILE